MRIYFETTVKGDFKSVFSRFDRDLFLFLTPPAQPVTLLRFDGSVKGDEIHLKFGFPVYGNWVSIVTDSGETEDACFFIDEGRTLPMGLRDWKHIHTVKKSLVPGHSVIVDDMHFSTGNWLFDRLLYPALYLAFIGRKPKYKKYFGAPSKQSDQK